MSPGTDHRAVTVTRTATGHYRAVNAAGVTLDFGTGDGEFSPVELLLAALAGCSAVDVDTVTSRRTEPERFTVEAHGEKVVDESGGNILQELGLDFDLAFPEDEAGRKAARLARRLVGLSHDRYCTVSRTVEAPSPVAVTLAVEPDPEQ
ncbi:OsmC family protein [Brevibacterium litoralis]|uniref:OsmC family protein n=1 Tax=Brevibacterium litoralis TaxID=3138935 RepID=UPI0032EF34C8